VTGKDHGVVLNATPSPAPQTSPLVPDGRICFWFGAGGSFVLVDAERRLTAAYLMNKLNPGIASANSAAYLGALARSHSGPAARRSVAAAGLPDHRSADHRWAGS
jgi:CubicO group peptidase (beta-lactamase class C family)